MCLTAARWEPICSFPLQAGFEDGKFLSLGILFVPALFFVTLGTDNGVNFTDGLDGLCTSVTILVATFLTIVAIGEDMGISPITGAVVGSLLGFLLFNVYPAKVFMGDTGSLALGGLCGFCSIYDASASVYSHNRSDLSGRGSVCYYSGNVFLKRQGERESLKWHPSIITLNCADGLKQGL